MFKKLVPVFASLILAAASIGATKLPATINNTEIIYQRKCQSSRPLSRFLCQSSSRQLRRICAESRNEW